MPTGMLLFFASVVGLVSYGLHTYLFARIALILGAAAPDARPFLESALGLEATLSFSLLTLSYFFAGSLLPVGRHRLLGWLSGAWMGLLALGCLWVGLHHASAALASLVDATLPPHIGPICLSVALLSWLWGITNALRPPTLVALNVPLADLPEGLDGLRIVQLSDVHVGPTIGRHFVEQLVERVNALTPDLIVITGDLVDGEVRKLKEDVAPFFELSAPLGVFFITGNHELISGVDSWVEHLRAGGMTVLENESRLLERDGAALNLVGVEDWESARFHPQRSPNLDRALSGCDTALTTLLLAHQPKAVREAAQRGVDLQLSGHTHGGQIAPFTWLVALDQPYRSGLYHVRDTALYVSEGTGYWGPPLRLGTRSELTLLTLTRSAS